MATTKGVTGNLGYYGEMVTGEYLAKLEGTSGMAIYDKMRRSDPQIRAVLRAVNLPIIQAKYRVLPGEDTPKGQEIADFVEACLFDWMGITWTEFINTALLMKPFGFSIFEKVWSKKDGKIILHKLDPRLPVSLYKWDVDQKTKTLKGIQQQDTDGQIYKIPIEKLVIFTNEKEGDNFAGFPILRPVYGSWMVKNELIKIDAIKHERYGVGMPIGEVPEGIKPGSQEWDDFQESIAKIYSQEQGYMVLPAGYKIDNPFGDTKGGTDVLTSIKWLNEQITASVLANFLSLGTTETGSRALGESMQDFFLMAEQETAQYICDIVSRWVIPELVKYNYDGVEMFPYLAVDDLAGMPMETMVLLKNAGLLNPGQEVENIIRDRLNLPDIERDGVETQTTNTPEEVPESVEQEGSTVITGGGVPSSEIKEIAEESDADLCEHSHGLDLAIKDDKELELWNHSESEMRLDLSQATVEKDMLTFRNEQAEAVVAQLIGGRKVQNIVIPNKADQYSKLLTEWEKEFQNGQAEAKRELTRQGLSLAGDKKPLESKKDFKKQIEEELSLVVESAGDKIKATAAAEYLTAKRAGYVGAELEKATLAGTLSRLGELTWKAMTAKAINEGWGNGREEIFQQYADEIEYIYHSVLLDSNACEICRPKDGQRVSLDNPEFQAPDPECLGRDFCRCVNVAVYKGEANG